MNKNITLAIGVLLFSIVSCVAQKTELSAGAGANLFNYTGSMAGSNVVFYSFPVYSKTLTTGFDANIKFKFINKKGWVLGMGTGYEALNSRANVKGYDEGFLIYPGTFTNFPYIESANGYEASTTKLVVLSPFAGYRFKKKGYSVDIFAGGDFGFIAEQRQHDVLLSPDNIDLAFYYNGSNNYNKQISRRDYRLKTGVDINYRRVGLDLSYAHGINSQIYVDPGLQDVGHGKVYSQLIKLGINYRIF